jgi:hypothetical protein
MGVERRIAELYKLSEKYRSNDTAYAVIVNGAGAVKSAFSAAENCRIEHVLNRVATLTRYHEYCKNRRLPDEVCSELGAMLWLIYAEIPKILQERCGCRVNWKSEGGQV